MQPEINNPDHENTGSKPVSSFRFRLSPVIFLVLRIISVAVYILTIIAAYGGYINPEDFTFPSLLCLGLPYLAIVTILFIIFWALARKLWFCSYGVLTILLCVGSLGNAFPLGWAREGSGKGETFKIMAWNVIHTWDLRHRDWTGNRAVSYMLNSGADLICLSELNNFTNKEIKDITEAQTDSLNAIYPYRGWKAGSGIRVLSKYPIERLNYSRYDHKGECRFDLFLVTFPEGRELVVAVVHLYSYGLTDRERKVVTEINSVKTAESSMREFKGSIRQKLKHAFKMRAEDASELREALNEIAPDIPLIVCGDFNDVPASWTYNIVKGDDLRDAYAETNIGPAVTYNMHAFYFHIDQMLYRGPLKALDLNVGKIDTSDHYPLIGEFEFE